MIPVHIGGGLEQPTAIFGLDPARPEKVCVGGLTMHEKSDDVGRPVWTIGARGRECRSLKQVVYGHAPDGFDTVVPAAVLKSGVRYTVVGYGLTGRPLARTPWRGGGDFVFEDGQWRPAPTFMPGR